jgi:hypothetical protein
MHTRTKTTKTAGLPSDRAGQPPWQDRNGLGLLTFTAPVLYLGGARSLSPSKSNINIRWLFTVAFPFWNLTYCDSGYKYLFEIILTWR